MRAEPREKIAEGENRNWKAPLCKRIPWVHGAIWNSREDLKPSLNMQEETEGQRGGEKGGRRGTGDIIFPPAGK